ncbi:hypothetical protein M6B38_256865 [Iris pallida]|uniref:Uncharacterized protein n=1 Tax=Iris pallida TaxID=29817 RepID=A0AAX6IIF0_IRIPA|nr:hypothetical protein M6B38_256865 [Iris pallida]
MRAQLYLCFPNFAPTIYMSEVHNTNKRYEFPDCGVGICGIILVAYQGGKNLVE